MKWLCRAPSRLGLCAAFSKVSVAAEKILVKSNWSPFFFRQEAHEVELSRQRETLLEWEKKLQEGQDRLLDGQKLLNQREEFANQRDEALKKIEMDLQDTKRQLDKERVALQEEETNLNSKVSSLNVREEVMYLLFSLYPPARGCLSILNVLLSSRAQSSGRSRLIRGSRSYYCSKRRLPAKSV